MLIPERAGCQAGLQDTFTDFFFNALNKCFKGQDTLVPGFPASYRNIPGLGFLSTA